MQALSYETLRQQGFAGYLLPDAPERILQFGEGNFLRAFVDDFVDVANEKAGFDAKVLLVQPRGSSKAAGINAQDGLYTLYRRGLAGGEAVDEKRVISCVSRCLELGGNYDAFLQAAANPALRYIISNTTEAGIVYDGVSAFDDAPPAAFPAKLARFLYQRFLASQDALLGGLVVLPCELNDDNGRLLQNCVRQYAKLWQLEDAFMAWLGSKVLFCSTLVDRIVTGYPAEAGELDEQNGYEDALLCVAEPYALWVIEGPNWLRDELPFAKAGLPALVVDDHRPYKQRKVRVLNGAHTAMVAVAFLAGQDIVRHCMQDEDIFGFAYGAVYCEILPTLDMPRAELEAFAHDVLERFKNPFIDHSLLAIALNSVAKWKARVLPTVKDFTCQTGQVPQRLAFGFAALLAFYHGQMASGKLQGNRNGAAYEVRDEPDVLAFFAENTQTDAVAFVQKVCGQMAFWGEDLNALPGFASATAGYLAQIHTLGAREALQQLNKQLAGQAKARTPWTE